MTARGRRLELYADAVRGERTSDIRLVRRFELPAAAVCGEDDRIIGITLTYGGEVAFATVNGVVGAVPIGAMHASHLVSHSINGPACDDPEAELEGISSSVAADERGGIYAVSNRAMYRFNLRRGRLRRAWRAPYETGGGAGGATISEGSGSTPTLMGTGRGDDRFVVITDGQRLMHLVLLWRDRIPRGWRRIAPGKSRRIACEVPVTFGDPEAKESVSEQSVVVRGYSSVVVNNALGLDPLFRPLPAELRPLSAFSAQVPGNEPHGVERIDWDPRARRCRSVWANREVSIPNGVPAVSVASRMVYGVGLRGSTWGLEGLDLDTGASRLWVSATPLPTDNSFFAQTTIASTAPSSAGTATGLTAFRRR